MKNFIEKWRGLVAGTLLVASALVAAETNGPQVKTLGGGPNQTSSARAGSADGGTFAFAKFKKPYSVAIGTNGDLFIADFGNGKIRKVTNPGGADSLTSTFASRLASPSGIAIDATNVIYVVTQGDGKLRKFSATGTLLQTVTGFRTPTAVAVTPAGAVYVSELGGGIYEVLPDGTSVLVASGFLRPRGLAVLPNGLLAVTESTGHSVRLVNPTNGISTLIAGGNGPGFLNGAGDVAKFNQPHGITVTASGALVVADRVNHRVRVIDTNYVVSTLYGVPRSEWASKYGGWVDGAGGENGPAAAREPAGVAAAGDTVFVTELYWNLLRKVSATGLDFTGLGSGISTNVVIIGTNSVVIVGTNIISLGFASGEASSDYVGAAGQTFFVPITLTLAPGQPIYSFQMGLSATGETGVAIEPLGSRFGSMVLQKTPIPDIYIPIPPNYTFTNESLNLLGVGWFERKGQTNLYDAKGQDLVTYSMAKNTLFEKAGGKVILGAYGFEIPPTATTNDTFRVAVRNPSGSSDGISQPVPLRIPTEDGLTAGTLNTVKRVTIASRLYLVGDSTPFRWLNAGDFGDFKLVNTDVMDLFQTIAYGLNEPRPRDSDLFDAEDSSNGSSINVPFGNDVSINSITDGDGFLNVDDLWVTFRRSLDPSLKWYARYWSNGIRQVVEVTNTLVAGFSTAAAPHKSQSKSAVVGPRPAAMLISDDALAGAGQTLEIPVQLSVTPGYSARVMLVSLSVEPLDGSPVVTVPIQFQTTPALQNPEFSNSRGGYDLAAAWLNHTIPGLAGDSLFGILTVKVPASAGNRAAYRVTFNHFSASPNGAALFDSRSSDGLILLSDRSASTWNDGISDAWRLRYFGSIFASDSALGADADGDGVVNSIEFQNGTNPTDATSF